MNGLYVVVRADLPPGLQMAQACHVALAYLKESPLAPVGENLVALHVPDEPALHRLYEKLMPDHHVSHFLEPDLGGQLTAIAVGGEAKSKLSSLPLALRCNITGHEPALPAGG